MRTEVAHRSTLNAIVVADICTVDTTNYAWIHNVQQPIQAAVFAGRFGHLSLRVARNAVGYYADRAVAKTATKPELPLSDRDCTHIHNITFSRDCILWAAGNLTPELNAEWRTPHMKQRKNICKIQNNTPV